MAETVEAGGVRLKFEGTADQLLAEIKKLSGSILSVGQAGATAGAAVSNSGAGMAKAFQAAQARLQAINNAVQQVAGVLGGLNTVEGEVASGAARIIGALASGGPVDAGIAAIGVGVTHLAKEWAQAKEMATAALQAMVSGGAEVQSAIGGLMATAAGLTGQQVKAQEEINFQLLRQGDLQGQLADYDVARLERFREYAANGKDIGDDLTRQIAAYDAIKAALDGVNGDLSNAEGELSRINELQKTIKANAEAEAAAREASAKAVDREYASLIRRLDTEKNSASVNNELSSGGRVDTEWNAEVDRILDEAERLEQWEKDMNDRAAKKAAAEESALAEQRSHLADLKKLNEEEAYARREATASLSASLVGAALGGSGGQAIGSIVGGAAGSVLAPMVGVDPLTGGAIGEVLGGLLGGLIDELPAAIEFVTSVFAALGVLLAPLNVVFQSWIPQMAAIGRIFGELTPVIAEFLSFFVAEGPVWTELLEAIIPLVAITARLAMVFLTIFPVVKGVVFILEEVARGLDALGDAIAGALNALNIVGVDTSTISADAPGGSTAAEVNAANAASDAATQDALLGFLAGYDENTEATKDNTRATRAAMEQLSNMPKMWKVALGRFQAINPEANTGGGGTGGVGAGGGSTHVYLGGEVIAVVLDKAKRAKALRDRGIAPAGGGTGPRGDD